MRKGMSLLWMPRRCAGPCRARRKLLRFGAMLWIVRASAHPPRCSILWACKPRINAQCVLIAGVRIAYLGDDLAKASQRYFGDRSNTVRTRRIASASW
jgi:hypothetical protein